jgi:lipoteichoic acid synthase
MMVNVKTDFAVDTVTTLFLLTNSLKLTILNSYLVHDFKPFHIGTRFLKTFLLTSLLYIGFFFPSRALFTSFYVLQLVYFNIVIAYYNFYCYFLHIRQSLALIKESLEVARYHAVPRSSNQLLTLIDLPIFGLALTLYDEIVPAIDPYQKLAAISFPVFLAIVELIKLARKESLLNLINTYPGSEFRLVKNYGTLVNMLVDLSLFPSHKQMIKQFDYGKPQAYPHKEKKKPNFLIIQVESLDSNAINLQHNGQSVMPFLQALTRESIYYPYMLNYHKAGGTSDAEFSIINSVEPLGNFPSIKIPSYDCGNSFVRLLSENSYQTAVFHGNKKKYYRRDKAFAKMGFDLFYDIRTMNLQQVGWGAPDHEVFQFVREKLKTETDPFLHYLITMSSHCRFTNALHYFNNRNFASIPNSNLRNFYNSLSYVDNALRSFIQEVRALNKETYIMIWGDHTPGLPGKLYREASLKIAERHLEFVPLFILTPDNQVYQENASAVSFLDIAPTILALAGIEAEYASFGDCLVPPGRTSGKIPYRGYLFDRKILYESIFTTPGDIP